MLLKFLLYIKNLLLIILLFGFTHALFYDTFSSFFSTTIEPCNKIGYLKIDTIPQDSLFITQQLKALFENPQIKAILLHLETAGGPSGTFQALAYELKALREKHNKMIVTYIENMCVSGGYYVAIMTHQIIATPSATIGSIGAKTKPFFDMQTFLKFYNISTHISKAGKHKTIGDSFAELQDDQKKVIQDVVDSLYQQFIQDVALQRNLSLKDHGIWADGKLFTGQQAKEFKLIDEVGSFSTALQYIKKNIEPHENDIQFVITPSKPSLIKKLFPMQDGIFYSSSMSITTLLQSFFSYLQQEYFPHFTHF